MNDQPATQLRRSASAAHSGHEKRSVDRVSEGLEEYGAAIDAGEPISREFLLAKYADVAEELVGCLDSLDFIRQVAPQLNDKVSGAGQDTDSGIRPLATLGDFRIVRELGRGGMGVVYEAEQLSLGRRVALKVLPFAAMLGDRQLKRFHNEARAAATLDHPNIVPVYSVGTERGVHYYAMRLIDGHNLAEIIAELSRDHRDSALGDPSLGDVTQSFASRVGSSQGHNATGTHETSSSPVASKSAETKRKIQAALSTVSGIHTPEFFQSVARLGVQAAEALDYAHEQGVIHRESPCRQRIGLVQRMLRWVSRHRTIVGVIVFVAAVWLIAAQIVAIYALRTSRIERREKTALTAEREYARANQALLSENLHRDVGRRLADTRDGTTDIPGHVIALYRRALRARQRLADDNPNSSEYYRDIAATRTSFGLLLARRGDIQAASNEMIEVLKILNPTKSRQLDGHYDCQELAGTVLRMAGRIAAALPYARPLGMRIGEDGLLYVSSRGLDSVVRINLKDGRLVDDLSPPNAVFSPHGLAFGPDKHLYVSCESEDRIVRFDCISGDFLGTFVPHVPHPVGIAFGPGDDLYVACHGGEIRQFSGSSGKFVSSWKADASRRLHAPTGLVFGPDGDLFVACQLSDRVERYAAPSGEFRGIFASGGGLKDPIYLDFGPDGDLYVVGRDSRAVHRYDGQSGEFVGVIASRSELVVPEGLAFGPSGDLYVNTTTDATILRIDAKTGVAHRVLR